MKNLKAPFLVIAILFLNVLLAGPKDMPVPYGAKTASTNGEDDGMDPIEECPPGYPCLNDFPIDQNITFLLVSGLVLGATIIYKNQIKKASI